MIRRVALTLLPGIALLAGCASQPAAPDQPTARTKTTRPASTMIVPASAAPLAEDIRRALTHDGWQLVTYQPTGSNNMPGNAKAMARRARYRLTLTSSPAGTCRGGDPSFMYQISIIENTSGNVPLALSGANCLTAIGREFQQELREKGLVLTSGAPATPVPDTTRR